MRKPDPFAALADRGGGRLSLPFLPTLVTALALGAASLLCREPTPTSTPAPAVPMASVEPRAFHAPLPAEAVLPRPTAAIAFAQFPPSFAPPEAPAAAAPPHPAVRLATAAPLRRACTGARCTEGPPRRPDPFAAIVQPAPAAVEAEAEIGDGLLPDLALPFAPAARIVGEAAALVRTGAASLGGSVSTLVDRLR